MWVKYGTVHRWGEKFPRKWAWSGSRDPFQKFNPPIFNICGINEATLFTFGSLIIYGMSHRRGEKFPMKVALSGSRDPFKSFKTPSIFLEWMKLRCLNLASKWIDYGKSHPKGKKFHPKGAWSGSRDRFWMKQRSLNLANASTMASATARVKNSL